jgi:hypothetical protein
MGKRLACKLRKEESRILKNYWRSHLRYPLKDGDESSIESAVDRDGIQGDHSHGWLSSRSEAPFSSIVGSG